MTALDQPAPGGPVPAGGVVSQQGFSTCPGGQSSLGPARHEELGDEEVLGIAGIPAQGVNTWTGDDGWLAPGLWAWLSYPWQPPLDSVSDTSLDVDMMTLLGCQTDPGEESSYNTFLRLSASQSDGYAKSASSTDRRGTLSCSQDGTILEDDHSREQVTNTSERASVWNSNKSQADVPSLSGTSRISKMSKTASVFIPQTIEEDRHLCLKRKGIYLELK